MQRTAYIIGDDGGQSITTTNSLACIMYRSYGTVTALFRSLIASRMSSSRAYNNPVSKECEVMVACVAPPSAVEIAPPILKLCAIPMGVIACSLELLTEMLEKPESDEWMTIAKAK